MKKSCRVLFVCLALIGATSRGFGEWPPLLAESTTPPSVSAAANSTRPALLTGASHVAQKAAAAAALPPMEIRRLDYGRLERNLAGQFPESKVYLIPMHSKVIVRGQCPTEDEATKVLWAINQAIVRIDGPHWKPSELSAIEQDLGFDSTPKMRAARRIINELRTGTMAVEAVPVIPGYEITQSAGVWRQLPLMQSNSLDARYSLPTTCFRSESTPAYSNPVSPHIAQLLSAQPTALKSDSKAASTAQGDSFTSQLRASEAELRRVGLTEAAEQLQSLHRKFETQHMEALFIEPAQARFDLKSYKSVIAGPKQGTRVHESQISLQVRLVELVDASKTHESLTALFGVPITKTALREGAGSAGGVFQTNEIRSLIECLCKSGQAKVVSEPKMTVLSGRECLYLSGGELAVPPGNSSNHSREVSYIPFGTSIHACPTVNGDLISLTVQAAHTRQEDAVKQVSQLGFSSRRLKTTVELVPGQTLVLAGLKTPPSRPTQAPQTEGKVTVVGSFVDDLAKSNSDDADLLIFITPEIVQPIEPREVPPVPVVEVVRPSRLPPAPVPAGE